jgi:plasmid stabilization system protein ParE
VKVIWLTRAQRNLAAQLNHIALDSPRAAIQQRVRVTDAVARLVDFPDSGRPGRIAATRELVVPGTPFIVAYRVRAAGVVIVAVLHGAQRWPERF